MRYRVSGIKGPPATGKTRVIAETVKTYLRYFPGKKVLVTAVTHVAVDEILKQLTLMLHGTPEASGVTRFYGHSKVVQDMLNTWSDKERLNRLDQAHLGARCLAMAKEESVLRETSYIKGLKAFKNSRVEHHVEVKRNWYDLHKKLQYSVLKKTAVLLCTSSSVRSEELINGEGERWPAGLLIFDEAGCAKPVDILQPVITMRSTLERLVFCGDDRQLGPCIFSRAAQDIWHPSWFTSFMKSGFPVTVLNEQYRSHHQLYQVTSDLFYSESILSRHRTNQPRPFLHSLLSLLPMTFSVQNRQWTVNSWRNFIDVDYAAHQKLDGAFTNPAEAACISALVKGLLRHTFIRPGNIAVITGYRAQAGLLRRLAKPENDNWRGVQVVGSWEPAFKWVPIGTVDGSQGAEYEIVIVSLVKNREGTSAGFIGEYERANVTNSRAREAVYFVGRWDFWTRERKQDRKDTNTNSKGVINRHYMSDIVNKHESLHQQNEGRSFVTCAVIKT